VSGEARSIPYTRHAFFRECPDFKDVRKKAIRYAGYSIGYSYSTNTKRWHASVRIDREQFLRLKAHLLESACLREVDALERELGSLRLEPYARVARQYLTLLRAVNRKRDVAGLQRVSHRCLRLARRSVYPFASA